MFINVKNKKCNIKIISTILFWIVLISKSFGQLPPNDPVYELVFNDDFNGTSVDYTKWDRIPPWNQGSNITTVCNPNVTTSVAYRKWKTNIPGQMDTTNCKVSNGSVKLYTRKENYVGEVWVWPNGVFDTPYGLSTSIDPATNDDIGVRLK